MTFFSAHTGICSVKIFPSQFMRIFSYRIKLSFSIIFLMSIFKMFAYLGVFINRFFMRISEMHIKIGGWKRSYCWKLFKFEKDAKKLEILQDVEEFSEKQKHFNCSEQLIKKQI